VCVCVRVCVCVCVRVRVSTTSCNLFLLLILHWDIILILMKCTRHINNSVTSYRYRWIIRWRYYKLRFLRQRRNDNMLLRDFNEELHYSSYVIYPYEDDRTIRWVTDTLVPGVERTLQKPQMFIKGRDDVGGK
jgi:hypothetical protein